MFNYRKASAAEANRATAFPSTRSASIIRRPDGGRRLPAAAQTSVEPDRYPDPEDRRGAIIGIALSVILASSALLAMAHIWANAGMIR